MRHRKPSIALVAMAVVLLVPAAGDATDGFIELPRSVTVAAGGTANVARTVHLDAAPPSADIEIAIDTTGSMSPAIAQAKADATQIVNEVRAKIIDAQFAVVAFKDAGDVDEVGDSTEYSVLTPLTESAEEVQTAINSLTAAGGGDAAEAYNLVFRNSYVPALGGDIGWRATTRKLVVVIGDAEPHGAGTADFAGCTDTSSDPNGLSTAAVLAGMHANERTLLMIRQPGAFASATLACYQTLVAAAFPAGKAVDSGESLGSQIVDLVNQAAAHIESLEVTAVNRANGVPNGGSPNPAAWVTFTGLPTGAVTAPEDVSFDALVSPPAEAVPGTYSVDIEVRADGVLRATQQLTIVVRTPLSNLSVTATPTNPGAGIDQLRIADIPNHFVSFYAGSTSSAPVGSTPVGSTPVGSTPVGSTPVGSTPVGSTPVGSTPVGSTPVGSTPVGSTGLLDLPVGSTPVGSTPVGSTALASLILSQIPLCGDVPLPGTSQTQCQTDGATWADVLGGTPFAAAPLNSLSLADVLTDATVKARLAALPLRDVSFATTLFKSVRWSSLLLGPTPLLDLPVPAGFSDWCAALAANGGSCANVDGSTTVLQMDVGGQLGSTPVGSTPVGSTPVGSTPVGSTPVGSTNVGASRLASIPLAGLSDVVDCANVDVDCATGTLGDAYAANAILPTATFSNPSLVAAMTAAGITVNDILVAILGAAGLPWELLSVQGLQPYSQTQSHVTYTLDVSVDCSVVSSYTLTARLPSGFFPVPETESISLNGGAPSDAGPPTVLGEDAAEAAGLNAYRWSLACAEETAGTVAVALSFDAYVGLRLGAATVDVTARAEDFTLDATDQAPVNVRQNGEPADDDPSSANAVLPNTLVVGHIGASGDQDFYNVDLTGLPSGTKISAFVNVPDETDLDLTISKPAAPSLLSNPVGSTPVGSTPIQDTGIGFSNTAQALPPETLQDVPVGSTPVGSTPVGSTPVGSTSINRGDVNEAAAIITRGESGVATIGISGYNGDASEEQYVLRISQTPPPPLPTSCPARGFANGAPASFASGTLPSSLPTATKSIFVVNRQRMYALYGRSATDALLERIGDQSKRRTFAGRSEVQGSVLQVDGSAAVRSAYAAWDASPCDVTLANDVVRKINDVIAGYRRSLPNLHYIVLLGTDEAIPMARTPDPVTLSPEQNEAADLAFTTNGLTTGNALYASAAGNNILTDGAYGAFTAISWLGRDLLLPEISVARLVETPADMQAQVSQYLASSGLADSPQVGPGTLEPTTLLTTGYDFLADGAQGITDNLAKNFPGATVQGTVGNNPAIAFPGSTTPWTAADVNSGFLQSASPTGIGSVNAHYNHWQLAAADNTLATTADASASLVSRILFTMGCHGGLNIPDTLGGSGPKYLDWAQRFGQKPVAMYIANTGYGYGDSEALALSERLLSLYAKNLHSDAGSVGEQWVATLQEYFAKAGAYQEYDAKVLQEATFYGLPFWHFGTAGTATPFTPLTTTADPELGTQAASLTVTPDAGDHQQFGLYRPIVPIASREVTSSSGPARGVWITALQTNDTPTDATLGRPVIDLTAHEGPPNVRPIFFPASPFTLARSTAFGERRDYVNVTGQFRPAGSGLSGTLRTVTSATVKVLYSTAVDAVSPLISQVNVTFSGGSATVRAQVTDDSGTVADVAALVNDGAWKYLQLTPDSADPTVFTGTIAVTQDPEVFVEATDGQNVSYSANKGFNFTSTTSEPPTGPEILIASPVGPYGANTVVLAAYSCPGATTCVGTVPNGSPIDTSPGLHAFRVTATEADGDTRTVQRIYLVTDLVLTASVTPTTARAGDWILAEASLTNTASVAREVTLSATFAFGTEFVVHSRPVTFTMSAGQTIGGSLPIRLPGKTPPGTYSVTLRASDVTGTVTATATLTVVK